MAVYDTGIGIPEDKLHRVFDNFTQVDGSYTRKYSGAGLGLAIVRRLTEAMDGNLTIANRDERGTEVHVSLPLGIADHDSIKTTEPESKLELKDCRILVVEDDPVNMVTALGMLEKLGCKPKGAGDGKEALQALSEDEYDCVLMDVQMPVMDGLEATRRIRGGADGVRPDLPIVFMTAHAMHGDRERFLEAGADDYIAKPVDISNLGTVLGRLKSKIRGTGYHS
jgi:CheY-like chemotaxis protein